MCHVFTLDANFLAFLQQIDDELAEQVQAGGCPHCGGPLHRASYPRKPRGVPHRQLDERYRRRHSFCCAADGCRRRCTPPSVRFLGRRVYLGVGATGTGGGNGDRHFPVLRGQAGVAPPRRGDDAVWL